jgi:hypothetical protein
LLRDGKLLAEMPPQQLMSMHNSSSLEEVFLTLSIKQDEMGIETHSTHVRTSINQLEALGDGILASRG